MKLFGNWFLIKKPYKRVTKRAVQFMEEYFGEALATNDQNRMQARKMGFEDGYKTCLEDLGINTTIENDLAVKKYIK